MAIMDWVHVLFRPFRDELSLTSDDGRDPQKRKREFRRKNGETSNRANRCPSAKDAPPQMFAYLNPSQRLSRLDDKRTTLASRLTWSLRHVRLHRASRW